MFFEINLFILTTNTALYVNIKCFHFKPTLLLDPSKEANLQTQRKLIIHGRLHLISSLRHILATHGA